MDFTPEQRAVLERLDPIMEAATGFPLLELDRRLAQSKEAADLLVREMPDTARDYLAGILAFHGRADLDKAMKADLSDLLTVFLSANGIDADAYHALPVEDQEGFFGGIHEHGNSARAWIETTGTAPPKFTFN
ncbi:hypothetical protein [Caenispirillum salinarum]|uniref:hypothetical protein n=1 Tax=Caenispirillum salinarum TaxID=859058 RepID=UPI00384C0A29